MAPGEDPL